MLCARCHTSTIQRSKNFHIKIEIHMSKTKKKLRSTLNYVPRSQDRETPKGKSLTVPDDSYTIRQIIERSQNGLPVNVGHEAGYPFEENNDFDSHDIESIQRMDLSEQYEKLEEIRIQRSTLEQELRDKKDAQKAKKLEQLKKLEEEKKAEIEQKKQKISPSEDKT